MELGIQSPMPIQDIQFFLFQVLIGHGTQLNQNQSQANTQLINHYYMMEISLNGLKKAMIWQ
jgi:hypothetical protein